MKFARPLLTRGETERLFGMRSWKVREPKEGRILWPFSRSLRSCGAA
jgi:hypothetical protein